MRKILILTTATGEGHNQAAKALKDILENDTTEVTIYDFLDGYNKLLDTFIIGGYDISATMLPSVYGAFYKVTNFRGINVILSKILKSSKKSILKYLNTNQPDIIACTHPLSVFVLDALKRNGKITVPVVSITTDFNPHYTYFARNLDAYITGSQYSKEKLTKQGISKDTIYPLGIPVNKKFYNKTKEIKERTDINAPFNILLMGGSMGLSSISSVLKKLVLNENKLNITIVCGRNEDLREELVLNYGTKIFKDKTISVLGFVNTIPELMDTMDLIITKPGGLTTTESIHKCLPMVIPFVIPGQESDNADFLCKEGTAIRVKHLDSLNEKINYLIDNPNKLLDMQKNMRRISKDFSAEKIVELFNNLYKEPPIIK